MDMNPGGWTEGVNAMNRSPISWRMERIRLVWLILLVAVLSGCQGMLLDQNGRVFPEHRIALVETGKDGGSWDTRDLRVDYRYERNGSEIKLSGKVFFADQIKYNATSLDYFHLDVLFLDEQGNILQMNGLTSTSYSDPSDSESFSLTLIVPAAARSMAFSYRGQARDNDEDGASSRYFWDYPVY